MQKIAINIVLAMYFLVFSIAIPASAEERDPDLAIIYSMYKNYAWVPIFKGGKIARVYLGNRMEFESEDVLDKFFDGSLAKLIVSDRKCVEDTKEECALGFDLLFGNQDPQASDLSINKIENNTIVVAYTYPSDGNKVSIYYKMIKTSNGSRVVDVEYIFDGTAHSLRNILLRKK